jgi:hypothetical protein
MKKKISILVLMFAAMFIFLPGEGDAAPSNEITGLTSGHGYTAGQYEFRYRFRPTRARSRVRRAVRRHRIKARRARHGRR